ncbi:MAG TPA: GNAT family N-acetyltransferase [Pyrinomonadaceae bacterium]|nr:GNAT family N-acetyltransferase [Pyrinomonadaceae bacterium]
MKRESNRQSEFTIRLAGEADARSLARLRYAFRASTGIATENEAIFLDRCTAWMEEHLAAESRWKCWVTEKNGKLTGCVWVQLVEKIPNPRDESENHAYLTNFYVEESMRGRGVGSRLLEEVIAWCRTHDVHAVILWPTNRSRGLYGRQGFAVRDDLMELIITDPAR